MAFSKQNFTGQEHIRRGQEPISEEVLACVTAIDEASKIYPPKYKVPEGQIENYAKALQLIAKTPIRAQFKNLSMVAYDKVVIAIAEALKTDKMVTGLDLSGCHVSQTGVEALAEALEENTTLQSLNLAQNNLTNKESILPLLQALQSSTREDLSEVARTYRANPEGNKTLTRLNLGNNIISQEGVEALCEFLTTNTTITHLGLNGCYCFKSSIYDINAQRMLHDVFKDLPNKPHNTTVQELDVSFIKDRNRDNFPDMESICVDSSKAEIKGRGY